MDQDTRYLDHLVFSVKIRLLATLNMTELL